ncbi:hypothetical protein [Lentzea sp. CA-135723]|uniref:hypothetical protein n=1 Tax=Lentzea sp. CA-135723 TaxID=3239950 RepID=UPI003D8DA714
MRISDSELARELDAVGLEFIEVVAQRPVLPTAPGHSPASSLREHGRFDTGAVHIDDPAFVARINADWWRMATEHGLFDARRECLFGLHLWVASEGEEYDANAYDESFAWVRVRLSDGAEGLDVAGDVCRHFRGWRFEEEGREFWVPEFSMLSVDSRMMIHTTLWGNHTVSTIVVRPDRLAAFGP